MEDGGTRPLVVTLALDSESQARFEAERRRYFPARLNRIPAHISLFHALPGEQQSAVHETLTGETRRAPAFPVEVVDVRRYGSGVGYQLASPELNAVHARLRSHWLPWLTRQDLQGFRPHVIVQNKAAQAEAGALLEKLAASFRPWQVTATGITLWAYEGGPWSRIAEFAFAGASGPQ